MIRKLAQLYGEKTGPVIWGGFCGSGRIELRMETDLLYNKLKNEVGSIN
jgi:hypothetical protein